MDFKVFDTQKIDEYELTHLLPICRYFFSSHFGMKWN